MHLDSTWIALSNGINYSSNPIVKRVVVVGV